ncbi:MAG TPA: M14 family metallopeptidase [Phycisphaerales bacterium]|nr:M14 family metallopeptidase [Phycisphaerales bacterium]
MTAPGKNSSLRIPAMFTHKSSIRSVLAACITTVFTFVNAPANAQQQIPSKTDLTFNHFYDYEALTAALKQLVEKYPDLLKLQSIGKSSQGRDMWLVTMNNPATGPESDKPAMWIDGNVHGNEIQAAEVVLYSIWYLTKSYGQVPDLTKLIDRTTFYFLPTQNPDGRAGWFANPTTPHDYRSGQHPTDNDYDGMEDEDGPEDLNHDGSIGTMWKADPNGQFKRSTKDPRIFERVTYPEKGQWSYAGQEGIDNDGDGRINEDGPGGYDMNRNWPADWQPNYIQFGAGDYPFSFPEADCIGQFILKHPNIAAVQSYHNNGGMILRGPGAEYRNADYPDPDVQVYNRLGQAGEELLPFYKYMIIYADLYTVHGGFVNWTAEGLGIISFTNELWNDDQILDDKNTHLDQEGELRWQDRMLFGQTFNDYTEYDHPTLGKVLIGGGSKYSSRIPPPFMLEEECHRNFAFTMYHAGNMPQLSFPWIEVKKLADTGDASHALWQITLEVENSKIIPSRTARASQTRIGEPDRLVLSFNPAFQDAALVKDPHVNPNEIGVIAAGTLNDRYDKTINPVEHRKNIITVERGIPGESRSTFRYLICVPASAPPDKQIKVTLTYSAEKATDITATFPLAESVIPASTEDTK